MLLQTRAPACVVSLLLCGCLANAQGWSEGQILEKFETASPYLREARASVAVVRAEAAGRALLTNPAFLASREGAGYAAFFQFEQQLPVSGRLGILRQAGASAIGAEEATSAGILWRLRTDLRLAFYRLLAAQTRASILADGTHELAEVIRVLRAREAEGEGSRYDRLRAEREAAEYRSQLAGVGAEVALARSVLLAYLPEDTSVQRVNGFLQTKPPGPALDALLTRALSHRSELLFEQRQTERLRLEARAAERLRIPEPLAIAGLKRGDVQPGRRETAAAIGISIPLPVFNKGQTEVARFTAQQQRSEARRQALERRIRAEVSGALQSLQLRQAAVEQYRREVAEAGADLNRIARVAYDEGELGILELLDSYRVNRQARLREVELEALAKEAAIELDRAVGEEVIP